MKHEVDKLISNALILHGEVWVPEVGTLMLRYHGAQLLSAKRLRSPYRELLFTIERRGVSLVDLVAKMADVTIERAEAICHEWVVQSSAEGAVTIEGVCRIEGRRVVVDERFEAVINPCGRRVVPLHPRRKGVVVSLLCVVALCAAAAGLYFSGVLSSKSTAVQPQEQSVVAEPANGNLTVTVEEVEVQEMVNAEPVQAEPQPVELAAPTVMAEQPKTVEKSVPKAAEQPQTTSKSAAAPKSNKPSKAADKYAVHPLSRGSYVVWGVYREKKNADDAMNWLGRRYPDIDAKMYTFGKRYMVALFKSKTRDEANAHIRALRKRSRAFADVWAHTK